MTKKRILIVEDEPITALSEKECLEKAGYEVVGIVDSGEEALKMDEAAKPDLVLMDIVLKGRLDGVETAWKIIENHTIPIIFITAHGDKDVYDAARGEQLSYYIVKPYSDGLLLDTIEAAFKGELETPGMTFKNPKGYPR